MSKSDKEKSDKGLRESTEEGIVSLMKTSGSRPIPFECLEKGMHARVVAIHAGDEDQQRLLEMGLTVGTRFTVVKVAPFGDPVEIDLRGYRLCLRKKETRNFEIELVE